MAGTNDAETNCGPTTLLKHYTKQSWLTGCWSDSVKLLAREMNVPGGQCFGETARERHELLVACFSPVCAQCTYERADGTLRCPDPRRHGLRLPAIEKRPSSVRVANRLWILSRFCRVIACFFFFFFLRGRLVLESGNLKIGNDIFVSKPFYSCERTQESASYSKSRELRSVFLLSVLLRV